MSYTKTQMSAVESILREWDPIGVIPDLVADGLAPDEYDSYVPHIVGLLARGCSREELADHLSNCRTNAMGLPARKSEDLEIAEKLLASWKA